MNEKSSLGSDTLGQPNVSTTQQNPIPSIRVQIARLSHLCSRAGHENLPLYFLMRKRPNIGAAPPGAPLREKMRRVLTRVAIFLFWPIARLTLLHHVWRYPPQIQPALEWWNAIEAARNGHKPETPATLGSA